MLTAAQAEAYRQDGFVKAEGLFNPQEIDELNHEMNWIIEEWWIVVRIVICFPLYRTIHRVRHHDRCQTIDQISSNAKVVESIITFDEWIRNVINLGDVEPFHVRLTNRKVRRTFHAFWLD